MEQNTDKRLASAVIKTSNSNLSRIKQIGLICESIYLLQSNSKSTKGILKRLKE